MLYLELVVSHDQEVSMFFFPSITPTIGTSLVQLCCLAHCRMKSLTSNTALVDASWSMHWSMERKMVSLLSHLVGLWIVSGKMVIELIRFSIDMFWIGLLSCWLKFSPCVMKSCNTGTWNNFHICQFSPHIEIRLLCWLYPKVFV